MNRTHLRSVVLLFTLVTSGLSIADDAVEQSEGPPFQDYAIISRDVVVKEGDSLTSIAREQLGKAGLAPLLAEHNNLSLSTVLQPGDIIRIPLQVPPRGEYAEVVFVKGTVTATRRVESGTGTTSANAMAQPVAVNAAQTGFSTEIATLERGSEVYAGDLIETSANGYVSIAFSSNSVINLQPDTTAILQRLLCLDSDDSCIIDIDTERGRVTSDVEARDQQPVEFRINTPYASAAVRGTVFDMNASDQLLVGVTEGAVDVSAQGTDVEVDTGFGTVVTEGEAPSAPIELMPAPVFRRVPARIAEGDTVEWWPFDNAAGYEVQLSNDEAANETNNQFDIDIDDIALALKDSLPEPVDAGDYFLTVRAIDANGLRGFTTNTRVTLADIDPDIAPVSTRVLREGSEFVITVEEDDRPDEAQGYEIQISSDESFADPLSLDVNDQGVAIFRIDADQVFTRARVLLDPFTVSAFGDITTN